MWRRACPARPRLSYIASTTNIPRQLPGSILPADGVCARAGTAEALAICRSSPRPHSCPQAHLAGSQLPAATPAIIGSRKLRAASVAWPRSSQPSSSSLFNLRKEPNHRPGSAGSSSGIECVARASKVCRMASRRLAPCSPATLAMSRMSAKSLTRLLCWVLP